MLLSIISLRRITLRRSSIAAHSNRRHCNCSKPSSGEVGGSSLSAGRDSTCGRCAKGWTICRRRTGRFGGSCCGRSEPQGGGDPASEGVEALAERLKRLDPVYYGEVDLRNPARVLRAVEVCLQTGRPFSSQRTGLRKQRPFDIVKIGVTLPREELYARIDRRVDAMLEAGLEEEARRMLPYRSLNALQTVGYREFFDYFDGTVTRDEAITLIKRNSRRYAKRQLTWFRRDAEIRWFSPFDTEGVIAWIDTQSGAGEY